MPGAVRACFPRAHTAVLARPWVEGLYRQEPFADEIIPYQPANGLAGVRDRWAAAQRLRAGRFDCAVLLQNAFDAALVTAMAGIPRRIGYARDVTPLQTVEARHEMFHQQRHILAPLAQGREFKADNINAVKQIRTNLPLAHE